VSTSAFDLGGRTALVTGARRGIGRATACALAAAGARVVRVSAKEHEEAGHSYRCDFAKRDAVYDLVARVQRDVGAVDILVNNAGTIERAAAADHADLLWDRVLEVDLSAQFVLTREFGRGMLERRHGKVVFVASILSFQGGINVPGYVAAKSGVAGLTRALANEWAGHGVNVNAVAPGYVRTDNTQALRDDSLRYEQILARIPAGRWAEPADIAGAIVFLCSSAADYVHGTILPVDGGWLAR